LIILQGLSVLSDRHGVVGVHRRANIENSTAGGRKCSSFVRQVGLECHSTGRGYSSLSCGEC